jgi:hypothetical protein
MRARTVATVLLMACTLGAAPLSGRIAIGGGRHLYLECHGSGSPTVVLDAGHRGRGDLWNVSDDPKATTVLAGVQQFTRVCTYDRPGTVGSAPEDFGRSDPVQCREMRRPR